MQNFTFSTIVDIEKKVEPGELRLQFKTETLP